MNIVPIRKTPKPALSRDQHEAIIQITRDEMKRIAGEAAPAIVRRAVKMIAFTPRETEVAHLVAQGLKDREVAAQLNVAPNTIAVNLRRIYMKAGVRNRTELALRLREDR